MSGTIELGYASTMPNARAMRRVLSTQLGKPVGITKVLNRRGYVLVVQCTVSTRCVSPDGHAGEHTLFPAECEE